MMTVTLDEIARGPDQAIWVTEKTAGGLIRFNIAKE